MKIGGLEKFSMIDFPGCLSAVVFTKGCTFRCPFCYNPMLVLSEDRNKNSFLPQGIEQEKDHTLTEDDLFRFLESRRGKLDGVVISGGEPTMQPDLPMFISRIKKLGFLVKLDTNGSNPEMLKKVLDSGDVAYVAMDIKADEDNYARAAGAEIDLVKIKNSVKIIKESGLPCEFRTTCVPGFIDEDIIKRMGEMIRGADKWYLQNFKSDAELINKSLFGLPGFTEDRMNKFSNLGRGYVKICEPR